jgi:hypothetical protein
MMADISAQTKKVRQKGIVSPRNVFTNQDKNLSNISKNYLDDFDDRISQFDDGKSGNRNTGLYSNKAKKTGMNSRHDDIFDVRADAINVEK